MSEKHDRDREIIAAATPGPWTYDGDSEMGQLGNVTIWADDDKEVACQVIDDGTDGYIGNIGAPIQELGDGGLYTHHNAAFISRARTRWPELLDEVERLQAGFRLALNAHSPGELTDAEKVELNALLEEFGE